MYDFAERPAFDEPRGREAKGEGPYYRCYQAADGWFFLAMRKDRAPAVVARLLGSAAAVTSAQLEASLVELFKTQPADVWRHRLRDLDVAVQPLESLAGVRSASLADTGTARTIRFVSDANHPLGRAVEHIEPTAIRPLRSTIVPLAAASKYGADTRSVLRELGYSPAEIDDMVASQVIAESWSEAYLPD
jgi:crotonobetainyl-CoA:carnitine CoA-transferase CaiB-like acyl-CoA transferase